MNHFQELLVLLILAHLIGDFLFQRTDWVKQRQEKRWASPALYLHGFFHIVLSILALLYTGNIEFWYLGVLIGTVHIIIDPIKKPEFKAQTLWFLGDQLIHLGILTGTAYVIYTQSAVDTLAALKVNWSVITAYIFLTKPASIFISYLLPSRPSLLEKETKIKGLGSDKSQKGIGNAGEYIGILERVLTFTFILQGAWIGIGFLITAKSVFRFSDIQQSKQREETEYIMIGTLLSFSIAIFCGLFFL